MALTEVQLRYFLSDDGSVRILSLDGRTCNGFVRYVDPRTGLRRFDQYLREMHPDYIELGQFYPSEPILPVVEQRLGEGQTEIEVDGFRFLRTQEPDFVKYVHGK